MGTLDGTGFSRALAPAIAGTLAPPVLDESFSSDLPGPDPGRMRTLQGAPLSVWFVDQVVCPEYDAYVAAHPDGTLFHQLDWRAALIDSAAGEPFYLMVMAGHRVAGVLPLLEHTSGQGRVLESLPHTPVAGVLADDAHTARVLLERAARLAQRRGVAALVLRSQSTHSAAGGDGAPSWTRLPLAALRAAGAGPAGATPRVLQKAALATLGTTRIAALSRIDPTIGVLAAWRSRSRAEPVCLLERVAPSISRPRVVYMMHGGVARVFDLAGIDHTGAVRLAVLRQVAAMLPAACRWIECSLAPHECSALHISGADEAVRFAVAQSFQPAELLALLAARSE